MRLYQAKIPSIATQIVRDLLKDADIEAEAPKNVEQDVAAVLKSYLDAERNVTERTKDLMQVRGLPQAEFARTKKLVAEQHGIAIGDEMLDYLLDQLVSMLLHSGNVDEVFAPDVDMRRKMTMVLKKELALEEQIEQETR
ncbi:MAG: DUF507 family protein, partial [Polyangiaceae bacterium]|nr:DUF507 family protein [Polyangiaceae bacterium]